MLEYLQSRFTDNEMLDYGRRQTIHTMTRRVHSSRRTARTETWPCLEDCRWFAEVDGLKKSPYLLETARRHIEGDITISKAKQLIDSYYKSQTGRKETEGERTEETDKVSARITELLQKQTFNSRQHN